MKNIPQAQAGAPLSRQAKKPNTANVPHKVVSQSRSGDMKPV